MNLSRRAFAGGALSVALSGPLAGAALAQARPDLSAALRAIGAYAEAHRRFFGLPGLTLGLAAPDGFTTTLNFGFANADARTPIGPDTLFQIGSISKAMTAAVIHQLAAEGRLSLTDRVNGLLPEIPLPAGNAITVQDLLDHSAGLPDSPPLFPDGGLWTAYPPGTHWHYSNIGYVILGRIAEHVGGKPLAKLLAERVLAPLGMRRSLGAIVATERARYAQGYEAADQTAEFARGTPLAPAPWMDVTDGNASVASTADDMTRFLSTLTSAVQGRGAFGLSPAQAKLFVGHAVPSDVAGMSYGNGLMHVGGGGRSYLHHTGGMVSFSSAFHLDIASGVGAFASTNLSAFAEYRPRTLTRFAVDALTNAMAGRPLPTPLALDVQLPYPAAYAGLYRGPGGSFEVRAGSPLTIVAGGQSAALQPWGGDLFRTTHPSFRQFSLLFERTRGTITGASWGAQSFVKNGTGGVIPRSDPALARLAGRYVNDDPWYGLAWVVERGGRLWIGTETPMTPVGADLWRIGPESWSPERGAFRDLIDGRPQTFLFSAVKFARHDI